ncbi:hypothetical protein ABIE69_003243 [Rhodobacteraceae bacterium MBR-64]
MTTGKRKSERSTRRKLSSPGRPPLWQRKHLCRFWRGIAAGLSSEYPFWSVGFWGPFPVGFGEFDQFAYPQSLKLGNWYEILRPPLYRNGERWVIAGRYKTTLPTSSQFCPDGHWPPSLKQL